MDRNWVLTDTSAGLWVESLSLGPETLAIAGCSVRKSRLRGGLSDGVDIIEVACGELSFSVLPTRGMGLWRGALGDQALGWRSPARGPVHPGFVNQADRGGQGWLRGFDEWIVRCGLESHGAPGADDDGTMLTLHGKIANLPAHLVTITADPAAQTISVTGHIDESAFFHPSLRLETTISASAASSRITITDRVRNLGDRNTELEMLYHCNYGLPFLGEGSRFLIPYAEITPFNQHAADAIDQFATYQGPTAGFAEQAYLFKPAARSNDAATLAAVTNAAGDAAAVLRFDLNQLPCFTLWKNTAGAADGYVTGLEPGTDYPNHRRVERAAGRVVSLAPGGVYDVTLMHEVVVGDQAVAAIMDEVGEIQVGAPATVHPAPPA